MRHRLRVACALTALTATLWCAPVAAVVPAQFPDLPEGITEDDVDRYFTILETEGWWVPFETEDRMLESLFIEMALLEDLDALTPEPGGNVALVHRRYAPMPTDDREVLVELLRVADAELAAAGAEYRDVIDDPAVPLAAVDLIDESDLAAISAGQTRIVPVAAYTSTLSVVLSRGTNDVLRREGLLGMEMTELPFALDVLARPQAIDHMVDLVAPDTTTGPGISATDPPVQTESAADPGLPADPDPSESGTDASTTSVAGSGDGDGSGSVTSPLMLAALTVAITAVAVMFLRRRGGTAERHRHPDLSDLNRRLMGADDEEEVGSVAVPEALALAGATSGTILRPVRPGLLRTVGRAETIGPSRMSQVAETGQAYLGEVMGDPAVGGGRAHVAAVPLIASGTTAGVLVVWRHDRGFADEVRVRLEPVAPFVAAALLGADRLRDERALAYVDQLTSLGNRRKLDRDLAAELQQAASSGLPVAFAMVDVDHFKSYNDTHGHTAGDHVLRQVADTISQNVRVGDVVYRYGGEEFSILLPGATVEEARAVAERVRAAVRDARFVGEEHQPGGSLTVSVGVATLASSAPESIKERADAALYDAKSGGRNRVVVA